MQKLTLHTSTKKHVVFVPTKWNELNLQQLIEIETVWRQKPDVLKAFSILTRLNIKEVQNLNNKSIERDIFSVVQFLTKTPEWDKLEHPKYLQIGSKYYKVPFRASSFMIGQKIMLMQTVETIETLMQNIPLAIAIIMQPHIDKVKNKGVLEYDEKRVNQIQQELLNSPGLDCFATASFFFAKFRTLSIITTTDFQKYQQSKPKTTKLLKKWLKANV